MYASVVCLSVCMCACCLLQIREMLDSCRIEAVRRSLGRPYRLVAELPLQGWQQQQQQEGKVFVPLSCCLNQHPAPGVYRCSVRLYIGADRDGDLQQLQQEFPDSSSSLSSGKGGAAGGAAASRSVQVLSRNVTARPAWPQDHSRNGGSKWCVAAAAVEVEVSLNGLLLPLELSDAAEACLSNAANHGSSSSDSGSDDGTGIGAAAVRPTAWDTDDRDDDDDDEEESGGAAVGNISKCLVAIDFESCLMQLCALR